VPDVVNENLCRERQRVQDERFARDKERIEDLEQVCDKLNRLSIEMSELVKKHDEQLTRQDKRLEAIEQKPLRWWEKFTGAIITALGSAVGGGVLVLLIENLVQR
jgi:vacuolar-type H+-ATPase subunit I/STV1